MEDTTILKAMEISGKLRADGLKVEAPHIRKSLKAQMKYANKLGCRYVAILWDEDIKKGQIVLKDMNKAGKEKKIKVKKAETKIKKMYNNNTSIFKK
jgi:histidyl-tRNA synthetase